jgi:hypothetical protein
LPAECAAVPDVFHLIDNPIVRRTVLRDSVPLDGVLDRWNARGEFVLPDNISIDPHSKVVHFILNQNDGTNQSHEIYHPVLDPASCAGGACFQTRADRRGVIKGWKFKLRASQASLAEAPGLRLSRFMRAAPLLRTGGTFKFTLKGAGGVILTPELNAETRRVRQSIVIGDVCITRLVDCAPKGTSYMCRTAHCKNGIRERREKCGEPGLPSCAAGETCDTCRCVSAP